jgi:hypothetical protein
MLKSCKRTASSNNAKIEYALTSALHAVIYLANEADFTPGTTRKAGESMCLTTSLFPHVARLQKLVLNYEHCRKQAFLGQK